MKTRSLVLDTKRVSLLGALLVAGMVSACVSSEEADARKAAFHATEAAFGDCVAKAGVTDGTYTANIVQNSSGAVSFKLIATGNVTQAQADKANACMRTKGL